MRRDIILDTETTGLEVKSGDRVIEIGCIEMVNLFPTGKTFHAYINPGRPVAKDAINIHGLDDAFLADKPKFAAICPDFLAFIQDSTLVIHNASFDVGFLNAELSRLGHPRLAEDRIVDTLQLARRKHPAGPNNLDALCQRYGIDNSRRKHHGALLDAELLAEVYIELLGGKQADLGLSDAGRTGSDGRTSRTRSTIPPRPVPLAPRLHPEEEAAHAAFVAKLGAAALWQKYAAPTEPAEP